MVCPADSCLGEICSLSMGNVVGCREAGMLRHCEDAAAFAAVRRFEAAAENLPVSFVIRR